MKLIVVSLFLLGSARLLASPVSVFIDSKEMLALLNIQIKHMEYEGVSNVAEVAIELTWNPVPEDEQVPPRFDLIISSSEEAGGRLISVRYEPNEMGICSADFSVRKSDADKVSLIFVNGQNTIHGFTLSDYLNGFSDPNPNPRIGFGFGEPTEKPKPKAELGVGLKGFQP